MKKKVLILFFVLLLMANLIYAEDWPFGFPTANLNVKDAVPIELLRKIALIEARKAWGNNVNIGFEIPCSDKDGNITCYMIIFQIKGESVGSYKEILRDIKEGQRLYNEAKKEMKNIKKSQISSPAKKMKKQEGKQEKKETIIQRQTQMNSSSAVPQSVEVTEEFSQAYQKFILGRAKRWGSDNYGTIVVSADKSKIVIRERIHGLPYFYSKGEVIYKKVTEAIGGDPSICRIYYLSPLDQYYEFESNGQQVWINPFPLDIFPQKPQKLIMWTVKTPSKADKEKIKNQWEYRIEQCLED